MTHLYCSISAAVRGSSTDAGGVTRLRGAYGTLERTELRTLGAGGSSGFGDGAEDGTAGGGMSLESLLMVRGESGLGADVAPPDVPGRDLETGGDAGRGAEGGSEAACLVGEPVGDSGAVRWFPGSASGELVGGVKLLSRKRSEAPDDRRRRRSGWL